MSAIVEYRPASIKIRDTSSNIKCPSFNSNTVVIIPVLILLVLVGRSISVDWSQPTSYAVGFPDMFSDNKMHTFG